MKNWIIGMVCAVGSLSSLAASELTAFPKSQNDDNYGFLNVQAGTVFMVPGAGLGLRVQSGHLGLDIAGGIGVPKLSTLKKSVYEVRGSVLSFGNPSSPHSHDEWYGGIGLGGGFAGAENDQRSAMVIPTVGKKLSQKSFVQLDGYIPVGKNLKTALNMSRNNELPVYPSVRVGVGF